MTDEQIKAIALASGFTERQQADGSMDLNGYVYAFAEEMYAEGQRAMQTRADRTIRPHGQSAGQIQFRSSSPRPPFVRSTAPLVR